MEPTLRTPAAFVSQTQRNTMLVALLVGALAMVGIYAGLLGLVQRDPVFLLLSAAVFIEILYSLSFQGLLYRYVLTDGGDMALDVYKRQSSPSWRRALRGGCGRWRRR